MKIVIGIAVGLCWGTLIALLNSRITRNAIARGTTSAVMTGNFIRTVVDVAALAAVFLLRKVLPFSFEATMISTAVALGLLTLFFAFRMAKAMGAKTAEAGKTAPEASCQEGDEPAHAVLSDPADPEDQGEKNL